MLELYHWEPNGASARALICLKEKGLDFTSHYADALDPKRYTPEFLAVNPRGELPVLVDRGQPIIESSYICEYLDEKFPTPPLMPEGSYQRWQVRAWQKHVDDFLAPSVGQLAWYTFGDHAYAATAAASIPVRERRDLWTASARGFDDDALERDRARVRTMVVQAEQDLGSSDWLVGGAFSLADIAVFAYAGYLPALTPHLVGAIAAPRFTAWHARVGSRPAVKAALAMARTPDPYAVAAPGAEPIRWG